MAKSIERTKASLKQRATGKDRALTLRMGVKKHVLPFELRVLASDDYVFVHIPPQAEIMKVTKDGLVMVTDANEAEAAAKTFRKSRKRASKSGGRSAEVPADVASALSKLPSGYRIGYDASGAIKLVKTRRRRK